MQKIYGTVSRILFSNNEDSSLTVAELKPPYQEQSVMISGKMSLSCNEEISVDGIWIEDPSHGRVFKVVELKRQADFEQKGIFNYLTSKNVKGIGPKIAQKIIETFSEKTLDVINKTPELLLNVPGLGPKKGSELIQQLNEQKTLRDLIIFLQHYDIPVHYARKLFAEFGANTISTLRNNPFILTKQIKGIGFKTADLIAIKLGLPRDSVHRIRAGIEFIIIESLEEGHSCLPFAHLLLKISSLLNTEVPENDVPVAEQAISADLNRLINGRHLVMDKINDVPTIWTKDLFLFEQTIAHDIRRIMYASKQIREIPQERSLNWVEEYLGISLAVKQKEAISRSLECKFHIITGGPGTGKTTITNAILNIFRHATHKIILAAPTGKAAKRLAEVTGKKAVTVHSLLGFSRENRSFKLNRKNPINTDLIIIDESGMLDTHLFKSLLQAIPDSAIIILIGDVNQLPSVGPGNVLKDMINSERISMTELNEVFRQVHDSGIITNAHRIKNGIFPELYKTTGKKDFLFFKKDEPEEALEKLVSLVTDTIPNKFHIPMRDIQVLSPMKKGILGTLNLNEAIRNVLNPGQKTLIRKQRKYSVGDKVMQIRNNYGKEIFNGDIGYIQSIDFHEKSLIVTFDGKYVFYSFSDLDELVLAYAISVHKYQGNESPCVVFPIHTSHYMMLYRNLFYTAITRGKKLVVLIGNIKAVSIAVSKNKIDSRFTGLKEAIQKTLTVELNDSINEIK